MLEKSTEKCQQQQADPGCCHAQSLQCADHLWAWAGSIAWSFCLSPSPTSCSASVCGSTDRTNPAADLAVSGSKLIRAKALFMGSTDAGGWQRG